MNISKNMYLLIITAVFTLIALIFWFYIIPKNLVQRDLSIGIFTSDIFMILTIVFLSLLFDARENAEWRKVRAHVYLKFETEINNLAETIFFFVKDGNKMMDSALDQIDMRKIHQAFFDSLYDLADNKKFENLILPLIFTEKAISAFTENENLTKIVLAYYSMLPADLNESLMSIQDLTETIKTTIKMQIKVEQILVMKSKQNINESAILSSLETIRKGNLTSLSSFFVQLVDQIKITNGIIHKYIEPHFP
jgi:hypothetical protein